MLMTLVDILFVFFCFFLILRQMLMNVSQPPANVTMRLCVITHADHTCAHANLDISEMSGIVQVPSIVLKASRLLLISILCFCLAG